MCDLLLFKRPRLSPCKLRIKLKTLNCHFISWCFVEISYLVKPSNLRFGSFKKVSEVVVLIGTQVVFVVFSPEVSLFSLVGPPYC